MKAAFQLILITARLWPLLAVAAVLTPAADNSLPPKTARADYCKLETFEKISQTLAERVRPLASK